MFGCDLDPRSLALLELGRALRASRYEFVTVTPETHRRVNARSPRQAWSLRDVFGWNRSFGRGTVPDGMLDLLRQAGALVESEAGLRSAVRFSSLGPHLFVHSGYPTIDADAVFFGPDTYRFCAMLLARAPSSSRCIVDVGCGSGAGGIMLASRASRVVLTDINEEALRLARVNVALADLENVEFVRSDVLSSVEGEMDLVVANPPYLADERKRTYRDGGGVIGEGLSVRIVVEALKRLRPGGTLLLYTGTPVVEGRDVFRQAVDSTLSSSGAVFAYCERDPDVFGDELDRPAYSSVERIAVVSLEVTRPHERGRDPSGNRASQGTESPAASSLRPDANT